MEFTEKLIIPKGSGLIHYFIAFYQANIKIKMSKSVAIITARGGSKRIPRKNIKNFCGQPIIKYSIDAALKAGCFDEVMVSTDDE